MSIANAYISHLCSGFGEQCLLFSGLKLKPKNHLSPPSPFLP